jgi:hypothetical protein
MIVIPMQETPPDALKTVELVAHYLESKDPPTATQVGGNATPGAWNGWNVEREQLPVKQRYAAYIVHKPVSR